MKALLSAGLAFISICAWAQPYTFTSLTEMEIKGKVKTITHEKFEAINNKELNEVVISRISGLSNFSIQFFNPEGLIEKREAYSADKFTGEKILNHLDTFKYENGRLVYQLNGDVHGQRLFPGYKGLEYNYEYKSDSVFLVFASDPHTFHSRYTFLKNEHTFERLYHNMKIHTTEKTSFDEHGRRKSLFSIDSEGKTVSNLAWEYPDGGGPNPVSSIRTDYRTHSTTTCFYQYNEYNDLVSETCQDEDPEVKRTYTYQYKYDHHGNWVEKKFFGSSGQTGNIHRRTFTYWDE